MTQRSGDLLRCPQLLRFRPDLTDVPDCSRVFVGQTSWSAGDLLVASAVWQILEEADREVRTQEVGARAIQRLN